MSFHHHENRSSLQGVPCLHPDFLDIPGDRTADFVFHLHGLDDYQSLPFFNSVSLSYQHCNDLSWHGYRHLLPSLELDPRLQAAQPHAPLIGELDMVASPVDQDPVLVLRDIHIHLERAVVHDQGIIGEAGFFAVDKNSFPSTAMR